MARPRKGWSLRPPRGPGESITVRFTDASGRGIERSTGTRDPVEAPKRAAEIYARAMTAAPVLRPRVDPLQPLDELFALWLSDMTTTHDAETIKTYTGYARRYVEVFRNSLGQIHRLSMADYQRARLGQVLRGTVLKERSALTSFLRWCVEQGVMLEEHVPTWTKLPKRATGVRSGHQRAAPVDVTIEQVRSWLAALPLWSRPRMGISHPIRARFIVQYETGLRPATISALSVPENWRPGADHLVIADAQDKARFGRKVPITPLARMALEATVTALHLEAGVIFGDHDYREAIEKARVAVGLPEDFAPYDLRHGRIGHLLDAGGDIRGVMFLVGHLLQTTTNTYVRGQEANAERALRAVGFGGIPGNGDVAMLSAKEGSRTLTGVTPLEPESDGPQRNQKDSADQPDALVPGSDSQGQGLGGPPETLTAAQKYLTVLRAEWDVFDALAAGAMLDGGDDGEA